MVKDSATVGVAGVRALRRGADAPHAEPAGFDEVGPPSEGNAASELMSTFSDLALGLDAVDEPNSGNGSGAPSSSWRD
jgi:hypothetical protein